MGNTDTTSAEGLAQDEVLREALGFPKDFGFGFKVTIFNVRMRRLRELLGLTQTELGHQVGVSSVTVGNIERFLKFPPKVLADKIASVLRTTKEDIFPDWLQFYVLDKSTREFVSTDMQIQQAIERAPWKALKSGWDEQETGDPNERVEVSDRDTRIREIVGTLTTRQRQVLILRFGLDGEGTRTLDQVGDIIHRHRELVRQIEAQALHNLRKSPLLKEVKAYAYKEGFFT